MGGEIPPLRENGISVLRYEKSPVNRDSKLERKGQRRSAFPTNYLPKALERAGRPRPYGKTEARLRHTECAYYFGYHFRLFRPVVRSRGFRRCVRCRGVGFRDGSVRARLRSRPLRHQYSIRSVVPDRVG